MISFVEKKARRIPGIAASSAPPAAPARDHHQRDHDGRRGSGEQQADRGAGDRAGVELPLAADVEQVHPKRDRCRQTGECKRCGRDDRLRERAVREEGCVEEPPEGMERRVMRRDQHDRCEEERNDDRRHRNDERQPARLVEAPLDAHQPRSAPPAISSPSSSTVAMFASRSPTIWPSYMTATRSASARISSRSSLISRTPTPRAAAPRR